MTIKAIETRYKGYRFRSRLEARWAVLFDTAGMKYDYEPEGFDTAAGKYLPDFKPREFWEWIEIKPHTTFDEDEVAKMAAFSRSNHRLYIVCGNPWPGEYQILEAAWEYPKYDKWPPAWLRNPSEHKVFAGFSVIKGAHFGQCQLCGRVQVCVEHCSGTDSVGIYCEPCDMRSDSEPGWIIPEGAYFHKGDSMVPSDWWPLETKRVINAFTAARSARFEHGETPK